MCFCLSPSHLILFPITITIEPEKMCVFAFCLYKKMKKSVAPLILNGSVQSVRKCILPMFLRLFGNLKWCVTEKIFLIFSRKIYYKLPKLCNRPKTELLNIPLKTLSYQLLYFTFNFKIRNVTYMLLQHICYIFMFCKRKTPLIFGGAI